MEVMLYYGNEIGQWSSVLNYGVCTMVRGIEACFELAEMCDGIDECFESCHRDYSENAEYYKCFIVALNNLLWKHYNKKRMVLAKKYDELWKKADRYAMNHFKGTDLQKILSFID